MSTFEQFLMERAEGQSPFNWQRDRQPSPEKPVLQPFPKLDKSNPSLQSIQQIDQLIRHFNHEQWQSLGSGAQTAWNKFMETWDDVYAVVTGDLNNPF